MALGHLVWITANACLTLISCLTMQLAFLFWVSPAVFLNTLFLWTWGWTLSTRTHQAGSHIVVDSLMRWGVKGGGRCYIVDSGHWGCLLCFLSVWLKFRTWLDQNLTVSQQTSCSAGLTVQLSSVDCSVDRFVKKSGFLCLLLCIRCPMVDFAWGRYVYGFVNVFAPQIEAYTSLSLLQELP